MDKPEQLKREKVALLDEARIILGQLKFRSRRYSFTGKPKSKEAEGVGDDAAEEFEYSPCSNDKDAVRHMARRYAFYLTGTTDTKLRSGEDLFFKADLGEADTHRVPLLEKQDTWTDSVFHIPTWSFLDEGVEWLERNE